MAASRVTLPLLLASLAIASATAQDLPTKSGPEDLEAEAKQLMDELPQLKEEAEVADVAVPGELPEATVERTKGALERARQKQQRWEKLARQGVLSRAEAEACVVEVADALARHERARVTQLRADLAALQQRQSRGEASPDLVTSAETALATAAQFSATADQQARTARLENARMNVERHRKLFSGGLVSRVQMQRAEANLRKLESDEPALSAGK